MAEVWVKEIELEGRKFILKFHRDSWDCLWCNGYEVIKKKLSSIFKKEKEIEYKEKIFEFWTPDENYIIEMSEERLQKMLKREKNKIKANEMLDNYVKEK